MSGVRAPWFALFRALLNVQFGLSAVRARICRREKLWQLAAAELGMLLVAAVIVGVVAAFTWALLQAVSQLGQPEVVLTLAHAAAATLVFLFAIGFVLSAFFFSNDTGLLFSWPLSARQILSAKFAVVLASEYLTIAPLLIPVYVVYARSVPVAWWFPGAAAVVFLLTPVVPLAVAALIALALMRLVGGSEERDLLVAVGVALTGAVYAAAALLLWRWLDRRLDGLYARLGER